MFKKNKTHINLIKNWDYSANSRKGKEGVKNNIKPEIARTAEVEKEGFSDFSKSKKNARFLKILASFLVAFFLIIFVLAGSLFLYFKGAYFAARDGAKNIQQAFSAAQNKNWSKAQELSVSARKDFELVAMRVTAFRSNFFISRLPFFGSQIRDVEYLAKSAEVLSRSGEQGLTLAVELADLFSENDKALSFSELEVEQKQKILQKIYESIPELNGIKANLELAYLNLAQVEADGLLRPWRGKILELETGLGQANETINKTIPIVEMLPVLAGYPSKSSFLVLLQNSDELRPTGGFLGTYGILEMENGEILRFDTHDIYHMDMPVKDSWRVEPPPPIKKYLVDNWFLRDSNWSPDWPSAAKQIEWFWQEENKLLFGAAQINNFSGQFAGVIGITPEFVENLLTLVGPVVVEGQEYDQENFTQLLEYRVEKGYVELGVPSWERKEVISEISKVIKTKLFNLPAWRWQEIMKVINASIYKKDLLVYLKDEQLQSFGSELGWSGEIKEVNGDYLMVVDANLAAFKTDLVMNKSISYQLEGVGGQWWAKIKINYAHYGKFDWRTTTYRTYTRLYVPLGSKLVKAEGITDGEVEIGEEFGKTFFAGFIDIDPGNIGNLYFEYQLPENIVKMIDGGFYSLDAQKQPGNNVQELIVDLSLPDNVKSYQPTGFFVDKLGEKRLIWRTDLSADRRFEVGF